MPVANFEGCTPDKAPIVPLGTPRFVKQSQPDSLVETGIRQDPETAGMRLQWYVTRGVYGYRLYRSDTSKDVGVPLSIKIVADINSSSPLTDTTAVDVDCLRTGIGFFCFLRAYGQDGSLSPTPDIIN